jgi:hypothetical protein
MSHKHLRFFRAAGTPFAVLSAEGKEDDVTRTLQVALCVVLVGLVRGPAVAGDSWTSSLGRYTRTLARQNEARAERAEATYQEATGTTETALARDPVYDYYYRGLQFYVDRSRHDDMRYMERRVLQVLNHPTALSSSCYSLRSPDFYMEHQWMERHLETREFYRRYYVHRWFAQPYYGRWVFRYR